MEGKLGYIRVAAAIPEVRVADCFYNVEKIADMVGEASAVHAEVVSFPELSVTAYTCGDLFLQDSLILSAEKSVSLLLEKTSGLDIIFIVGVPVLYGNRLYNAALVCRSGRILGIVPKTFLPNYAEFYEKRWFEPASGSICGITYAGQEVPMGKNLLFGKGNKTFAVELCEDLWSVIPPSSSHSIAGAHIIFNLSASDELTSKYDYIRQLVAQQSARTVSAYVYASSGPGESSTDLFFAGNALISENGRALAESERFSFEKRMIYADVDVDLLGNERRRISSYRDNADLSEVYRTVSLDLKEISSNGEIKREVDPFPFIPSGTDCRQKCEEVFSIQVGGLAKRILHTKAKSLVLGISGGLDSTLALLVCVKVCDQLKLSRKNIIGITMPGFGTSSRTYRNASGLMKSLGITAREISIVKACEQHFKDISFDPSLRDVTYENIQARERTKILMDYANMTGGLVVGTGDLSELALGWTTYNGDHMSMYAVNSGVPKTLVRYLVAWVAESMQDKDAESSKILEDILSTPVSPELLPPEEGEISQKTEHIVGPYELHDFFLYYLIRYGFSPYKIFYLALAAFGKKGYSAPVLLKWLEIFFKRFFSQQFKRSCMPDGPKVGAINLSPRGDWRMPSDAESTLWLQEISELKHIKWQ